MPRSRRTTATLREELFTTLEAVRDGRLNPQQGRVVADLADKIIATADLELRYSGVLSKLDKDGMDIATGPVLLTDGSDRQGGHDD